MQNITESNLITSFTGATNTSSFNLKGGRYRGHFTGSSSSAPTLSVLGPDGSTYLTVATFATGTAAATTANVPPGTYRWGSLNASYTYNFVIATCPAMASPPQ